MKKLFCLLLVFAMAVSAFAQVRITGNAPTARGGPGVDDFNRDIQDAFNDALKDLNDQLKVFQNADKFLRAMGDSSVYASHGATTRGYGGYKVFSATIGSVVGLQLPTGITSIMDDADRLSDSLKNDGDIKFGINPNIINANVGLNMGVFKFLPEHLGVLKRDDLYVGLRVGYINLSEIGIGDELKLNYNNLTLGLTANYQIIPSVSLAGLITWRGVNLGSGFIYNRNKLGLGLSVDNIEKPMENGASVVMQDPKASVDITTNTFIIPLEAITAIKLLIFNIPFGLGADISFGKTSLGAKDVSADVDLINLPPGYYRDNKGDVTATGGISNTPSIVNFKIMTGLGLSMGPVIVDLPITYYPASGYSVGVTLGAVY